MSRNALDPGLVPYLLLLVDVFVTILPDLDRTPETVTFVILKVMPVFYLASFVFYKEFGHLSLETATQVEHNLNSSPQVREGAISQKSGATCSDENGYDESQARIRADSSEPSNMFLKSRAFDQSNVANAAMANNMRANGTSNPRKETSAAPLLNKRYFLLGLLFSCVGDTCLVYKSLFELGMVAFGAMQLMYVLTLRPRRMRSRAAWAVVAPLSVSLYIVLFPGIDSSVLNLLVIVYGLLLHYMLFHAIACFESFPSHRSLSAMVGAFLFLASDFLIALNKWVTHTPCSEASILLTYYTAQLLLTIGVC